MVPTPCPIQAAEVLIIIFSSFISKVVLPISGSPTPIPEFLKAHAIPTNSCFSYSSLTANKVSLSAVPLSAICPLGSSCPGSIAFLYLISQGEIPTNSASLFMLASLANAD